MNILGALVNLLAIAFGIWAIVHMRPALLAMFADLERRTNPEAFDINLRKLMPAREIEDMKHAVLNLAAMGITPDQIRNATRLYARYGEPKNWGKN